MGMISPHIMGHAITDDFMCQINDLKPAVIKLVNGNLSEIDSRITYTPKPVYDMRVWAKNEHGSVDDFNYYYTMTSLENALGRFIQLIGENSLTKTQGREDVYWESFNEVGISESYLKFEKYRIGQFWQRYGVRSCVLNSGVGWTLPFDQMRARTAVAFKTKQAIKHEQYVFRAANECGLLETMRQYGAVFGIRSYGSGLMINEGLGIDWWHGPDRQAVSETDRHLKHNLQWYVDNPRVVYPPEMTNTWLAFRVARYHDQLKKLGYGDLKFIITEAGIDNVVAPATYEIYCQKRKAGGWRDWGVIWRELGWLLGKFEGNAAKRYAYDLEYAERQYQAYSDFLLGATVFGGTGNWQHFNPFPEVFMELAKKKEQPVIEDDEPTVIIPPPVVEPEPASTMTVPIEKLIIGKEDAEFLTQLYNRWANDCGLVSAVKPKVAMITGEPEAIGDMYAMVGRSPDNGTFTLSELEDILDLSGIQSAVYHHSTLGQIFEILQARRPIIALVRYEVMRQYGYETPLAGSFGHFVVVIGITLSDIYFYDPLQTTETISSMPVAGFLAAWDYYSRGFVAPDQQPSTLVIAAEFKAKVIAQPRLNVRKASTLDYSSLYKPYRYKYPGTIVPVYETHTDTDGNLWYRIGDGLWICAQFKGSVLAERIE